MGDLLCFWSFGGGGGDKKCDEKIYMTSWKRKLFLSGSVMDQSLV